MHESPLHGSCVSLSHGTLLSLSFCALQSRVRPTLIQRRGMQRMGRGGRGFKEEVGGKDGVCEV